MLKSFIDLMFILLCASLALLSRTIYVGESEAEAAQIGGGGPSGESRLIAVVVAADSLSISGEPVADSAALAERLADEIDATAVLVPEGDGVSHHRVMEVWAALRDANVTAKLAAAPKPEATP